MDTQPGSKALFHTPPNTERNMSMSQPLKQVMGLYREHGELVLLNVLGGYLISVNIHPLSKRDIVPLLKSGSLGVRSIPLK
jgi:hypothetical protein